MMQVFKENFSEEEIAFIMAIDSRFPERNIAFNFEVFLGHAPEHRPALADEKSKTLKRNGWGQKGVPWKDVETVHEHTTDMIEIIKLAIPDHPQLQRAVNIAYHHDKPETIASDFTPRDGVIKEDKYKMEYLAARVIYVAQPEGLECWQEFEECKTFAAQFDKDVDVLQMFKRGLKYAVTHPQADMSEHLPYCRGFNYKTAEGRKIFQKMDLKAA